MYNLFCCIILYVFVLLCCELVFVCKCVYSWWFVSCVCFWRFFVQSKCVRLKFTGCPIGHTLHNPTTIYIYIYIFINLKKLYRSTIISHIHYCINIPSVHWNSLQCESIDPPYLCLINQLVDCIHNELFLFYLFTCFLCSSDFLAINPSNPKQNQKMHYETLMSSFSCAPIQNPSHTRCTCMHPSTATTRRIWLVCNFLLATNASITQNASLFPPLLCERMRF